MSLSMCVCVFYMSVYQFPNSHPRVQPHVLELADCTAVCMTDELLTTPSAGCPCCLTSYALRIQHASSNSLGVPFQSCSKQKGGGKKIRVSSALLCNLKRVFFSFFFFFRSLFCKLKGIQLYKEHVQALEALAKHVFCCLLSLCLFMPKPLTSKVLLSFIYLFFNFFIMPAVVFGGR